MDDFRKMVWAAALLTGIPGIAQAYELDWWTIDCGGVIGSTGGTYGLSGTIGQPDAGAVMTGDGYALVGGFWHGGMTITTDVSDPEPGTQDSGAVAETVLRMHRSAPNPFRASATVSFELPSKQPVQLAVYDPAGRLCRTVLDRELDAGRHSVQWDGRDNDGRSIASGIYFVVLRTPVGEQKEKLVKVQ